MQAFATHSKGKKVSTDLTRKCNLGHYSVCCQDEVEPYQLVIQNIHYLTFAVL